ncbi:MAG: ABC transporter permease [Rhodospirillaceae bacterium]|nr:ABC transporter permease [Rhodospirillaceae bacterium]|tara:strand:+ start:1029 stop:2720 length:1692 start_codon:yes stop_codon:yes gene_type:complete
MIVVAASTASLAFLMETILDDVFTARDKTSLYIAASTVMGLFLLKGIATYGQTVIMSLVGQSILADLQKRMFDHLTRADLSFFHNHPTGGLIAHFINDVEKMRGTVAGVITAIGRDTLTLIFLVGVMFYQDWILTLASFFAFPTAIWPLVNIGKKMRKVSANTQKEIGLLTILLNEVFRDIRHVKSYGMEAHERGRASILIEQIFNLVFKAARTKAAAYPIMETLGGTAIVIVICYGGWQVIEGTRTTGTFFSFVTALLLAYDPVKKLVNLNAQLQEGLAASERVFRILNIEPTIVDSENARVIQRANGDISFNDLYFSYKKAAPILAGISMSIAAGETVALVGYSGAGKTTILNLLSRFFDPDSGSILLDNIDIRDIKITSLRNQVALVSQDISLFNDTIAANISYGSPNASPFEIASAAENAAAHNFISELPNGYDTIVGENGVKLSGGQRQRVAIARAMLKDAPVLLLDEATSSLDSESEKAVQNALFELMRNRTTIVIAHRLSTIQSADRIYVIEEGRIAESGCHIELLKRGGLYAKLHDIQFSAETEQMVDNNNRAQS